MITVFDTETTGLPKNWKAPVEELHNWPRAVQISWANMSSEGEILEKNNHIIYPDGFQIPMEASRIHGITTEIAKEEGVSISSVLDLIYDDISSADTVVAHNMSYDKNILGAEFLRAGMNNILQYKTKFCTMLNTTKLCKIPGKYGYKWPTLSELHIFLFGNDFEGAHDALNDVLACAACYFELKNGDYL